MLYTEKINQEVAHEVLITEETSSVYLYKGSLTDTPHRPRDTHAVIVLSPQSE